MIDTHAHLAALDSPDAVVERAAAAGVTRILTVGTDVEDGRRNLRLAEAHDGVFAILGIHPHEAGETTDADVAQLRALLAHPKAVAVGETGLDWFYKEPGREIQERNFRAHIRAAHAAGVPLVIHARSADADIERQFQMFQQTLRQTDGAGGTQPAAQVRPLPFGSIDADVLH